MGTIFEVDESTGNTTITGSLTMSSQQIHSVSDPTSAQDAATKNYVDTIAQGITWKASVQAATTSALPTNTYNNGASGVGATLTAVAPGVLTVDGYAVALNDRLLIKNEVAPANNGIYFVSTLGTVSVAYVLTRTLDYDTPAEVIAGTATFVEQGTVNSDSGFVQTTTGTITIGTSALSFTQFTGLGEVTAGTGLSKSGNVISLINPVAVNLGGTGLATLTAHNVLLGEGTSNVSFAAPGSANTALVSNGASSDPTFQAIVNSIAGTLNQVIASSSTGSITLSLPQSIATSSSPSFASETLSNTTNQLVLGTTNTLTISSTAPSASRTYTILDAGGSSNFLTSGWGQIVNADINNAAAIAVSKIALADTKLIVGNGSGVGAAVSMSGDATLADTGAITLATVNVSPGSTTISSITTNGKGLVTANSSATTTGSGSVVLAGSPTLTGTLTVPVIDITATTNQLVLGTTNTTTISSTAPSASRTYTIPDAGSAANMVLDHGNYTIAGTWTFSNNITLASSKAVIFTDNTTNTVTMQATNSTTSYTLKLPTTAGTSNYFLQTDGSGNTTWAPGGSGTISSGTTGHLSYYSGSTTLSDASGQTMSGSYTFSGGAGAITMSSSTIAMGANKITGLANGTASTDAVAFGQLLYLQLQSFQGNLNFTTTSTSYVTTGQSVTITPKNSSSMTKITVYANASCPQNGAITPTIYKNGTNMINAQGFGQMATSATNFSNPYMFTIIDGTSGSGPNTYTVYVLSANGGTVAWGNNDWAVIIAEEIL